jgi:hypothetical protein
MVRRTVGGAGGFEERRKGERYKLAVAVQLNDGTGITRDISASGIFFETESAYSIGDTIRLLLNFEHETPPVRGSRGAGRAAQWSIRRRRGADLVCFLLRTKEERAA